MKLLLRRLVASGEATVGLLSIDGKPECWTLEDQAQNKKVYAETRIPPGSYVLKAQKSGRFYKRYRERWPEWHRGMVEIADAPQFTHVLFHLGNKDDDTAGCILVGRKAKLVGRYTVEESRLAYQAFYPKVIDSVYDGSCQLTIVDDEASLLPPDPTDDTDLLALRQTVLGTAPGSSESLHKTCVAELLRRVDLLEHALKPER